MPTVDFLNVFSDTGLHRVRFLLFRCDAPETCFFDRPNIIPNQLKSDQNASRGGPDASEELRFASWVGKAVTRATKHERYEACGERERRKEWKEGQ